MHSLASLALLSLPVAYALPQGPGVVICDSTGVTKYSYDTKSTKDISEWENYDSRTCTSNSESCSNTQSDTITKEISIDFSVGGAFDLSEAVSSGLDFGVSVSYSNSKSIATEEPCPADSAKNPCVCGLQFNAHKKRATGTKTSTNACGKKVTEDFDVTVPVKKGDSPDVVWRACRSVRSECDAAKDMPACADGV